MLRLEAKPHQIECHANRLVGSQPAVYVATNWTVMFCHIVTDAESLALFI
jgi:hypothetical protein